MSKTVYHELFAQNHGMPTAASVAGCLVQTQSQYFLQKAFLIEWTLLPQGSGLVRWTAVPPEVLQLTQNKESEHDKSARQELSLAVV